jgi:hypothetical protein
LRRSRDEGSTRHAHPAAPRAQAIIVGAALLAFGASCRPVTGSEPSAIKLELQLPDTVWRGDAVPFRLVASNVSAHPMELELVGLPGRPGLTGFRLHILDFTGREVAHVPRAPRVPPLPPGAEITVVATAISRRIPAGGYLGWWAVWDERDNAGNAVPAGSYRVVGTVPLDTGDSIVSAARTILVLAPARDSRE